MYTQVMDPFGRKSIIIYYYPALDTVEVDPGDCSPAEVRGILHLLDVDDLIPVKGDENDDE